MDDLFLALFLLTIPVLIVSLIKPSWVKMPSRKIASLTLGGAMIVFFALFINLSDSSDTPATVAENSAPEASVEPAPTEETTADTMSKEDAQKELDELMALSTKAGLVTSYDISETGNTVSVGPVWYTQTAVQKKDFMAYVGNLKKAITGFRNLKIHDAYSDELVAEISSGFGELKVYK